MVTQIGLKDRLNKATSVEQIEKLMAEGAAYKEASPGTIRKWKRIAAKRTEAITNPPKATLVNAAGVGSRGDKGKSPKNLDNCNARNTKS